MVEANFYFGLLAAAVSVIGFGIYAVPLRTKRVSEKNVSPMVIQFYLGFSVSAVSILTLSYNHFIWSWWGVLGSAMWVLVQALFFASVTLLGFTMTPPIVCGLTISISFFWGYGYFGEPVKSLGLSLTAIAIMVCGIVLVTLTGTGFPDLILQKVQQARRRAMLKEGQSSQFIPLTHTTTDFESQEHLPIPDRGEGDKEDLVKDVVAEEGPEAPKEQAPSQTPRSKKDTMIGMLCAILCGIVNGSMMVPVSLFTREHAHSYPGELISLSYLFSFGVGVWMTTPLVAGIFFLVRRERPVLHFKVTVLPGLVGGVLWGIANIAAVYAVAFLGNVLGYPLTQTNIVVAGIMGIVFFKEIRGFAIFFFALSTLVLLLGVAILAYFGSP